jgi:hypothetical protein
VPILLHGSLYLFWHCIYCVWCPLLFVWLCVLFCTSVVLFCVICEFVCCVLLWYRCHRVKPHFHFRNIIIVIITIIICLIQVQKSIIFNRNLSEYFFTKVSLQNSYSIISVFLCMQICDSKINFLSA